MNQSGKPDPSCGNLLFVITQVLVFIVLFPDPALKEGKGLVLGLDRLCWPNFENDRYLHVHVKGIRNYARIIGKNFRLKKNNRCSIPQLIS